MLNLFPTNFSLYNKTICVSSQIFDPDLQQSVQHISADLGLFLSSCHLALNLHKIFKRVLGSHIAQGGVKRYVVDCKQIFSYVFRSLSDDASCSVNMQQSTFCFPLNGHMVSFFIHAH